MENEIPAHVCARIAETITKRGITISAHDVERIIVSKTMRLISSRDTVAAVLEEARSYGLEVPA